MKYERAPVPLPSPTGIVDARSLLLTLAPAETNL
jgi:hypothetical protein